MGKNRHAPDTSVPFCRMRTIDGTQATELGHWNVLFRPSNDRNRMVMNLHGRDGDNHNKSFHAAFNLDRAKEMYFRVRFEVEGFFDTLALEKEYWAWYKERTEKAEKSESDAA